MNITLDNSVIAVYSKRSIPESEKLYEGIRYIEWYFQRETRCGCLIAGELGASSKELPRNTPVYNWNSADAPISWLKFVKDYIGVKSNICLLRHYTEGKQHKQFVSNKDSITIVSLGNKRRLLLKKGDNKTEIMMECGDVLVINSGIEWSIPATKRDGDTIILEYKSA